MKVVPTKRKRNHAPSFRHIAKKSGQIKAALWGKHPVHILRVCNEGHRAPLESKDLSSPLSLPALILGLEGRLGRIERTRIAAALVQHVELADETDDRSHRRACEYLPASCGTT